MSLPRRLGATYRLQLRPGWGFDAAARTVPYLARLGVETVYVSPVAEAVPGSTHGYDGTDPTRLRAELGGAPAYDALVGACEGHGLGICVDHVPNHLATWPHGPWWRGLLAGGRDSEMGEVFDVDWEAGTGADGRPRVILPLLDRPLEDALAAGLVRLGQRDGQAVIEVGEGGARGEGGCGGGGGVMDLPVAGGAARPGDGVAEVLAAQHYRLADWHDRSARNYRRFFDIDGLAGVRVEVPAVFERTHELVIALARTGRLSALRVDHVDGLRDPVGYLRQLADATGVPVVVEKILTGDEQLPAGWATTGTTGYEVVDDVGGVLVDAGGLEQLVAAGRSEGDQPVGPLTVDTRRLVSETSFPAELGRVAGGLGVGVDTLREVVVRLPQYRTYLRPLEGDPTGSPEGTGTGVGQGEADEVAVWREAADKARADGAAGGGRDAALGTVAAAVADPGRRPGALRLQQLTGAVMAKGVEDTAWYRLAGPLAFCEVGGEPGLGRRDAVTRFHHRAAARAGRRSLGLVPGTTHDTKRSEDVRSRLYALSEMPEAFERGLAAARADLGLPADGGDLAFETRVAAQLALAVLPPLVAVGAGAAEGAGPGDAGWSDGASLADRLGAALEKGGREAKQRSSWQEPDAAYERRLHQLATALLADRAALVHRCFGPTVPELARRGALNSLTALVLRHASPGVPDTYQGDEAWNLSLVDPDNRRPVDYDLLAGALAGLPPVGTGAPLPASDNLVVLRHSWADGRIKLFVTAACLAARRSAAGPALAADAAYLPLVAGGPAAGSVLAFGRVAAAPSGPWLVAVATRLGGRLEASGADLPCGPCFAGTGLVLPDGAPARFRDVLSGREVAGGGHTGGRLALDEVLAVLPVALLVSCS